MASGNVSVVVAESGATVLVPAFKVQVVLGTSSIGTAAQPYATSSLASIVSTFGYGKLTEYCALAIAAGAVVIAVKLPSTTTGTAQAVQVVSTATPGTSVVTVTLDGTNGAFDDSFVVFKPVHSGTIGVTGITFQVSLDAGRTFGPILALGTATTYAIPNTGITLNFAAGTVVTTDLFQFQTLASKASNANILAALTALAASPYAIAGWGSAILLGFVSGSDATTIQGYVETLKVTNKIPMRLMMNLRDAAAPMAWGGAGETEAAWIAALSADVAAVSAKRVNASAGHYNMPSGVPNTACGVPKYRRALQWANAVRKVAVQPQVHTGRVRDGQLASIVVDAANDPLDGFIYHDDGDSGPLDTARLTSAKRRMKTTTGFWISNPNLLSPPGSDFTIQPLGDVMDVADNALFLSASQEVNDNRRLQTNGQLYAGDVQTIQKAVAAYIDISTAGMVSQGCVVTITPSNVRATGKVPITATIYAMGYILEIDATILFNNPNVAQAA